MQASHYVIERIIRKLDDTNAVKREFDRFSAQYQDDIAFQKVNKKFQKYLQMNTKKLDEIMSDLKRLEDARREANSI